MSELIALPTHIGDQLMWLGEELNDFCASLADDPDLAIDPDEDGESFVWDISGHLATLSDALDSISVELARRT